MKKIAFFSAVAVLAAIFFAGCAKLSVAPEASKYPVGFPQTAEALDTLWGTAESAVMPVGPKTFSDSGKFHLDYDTTQNGTMSKVRVFYDTKEIYTDTIVQPCGICVFWGATSDASPANLEDKLSFILIQDEFDCMYYRPNVRKFFINGRFIEGVRPYMDVRFFDNRFGHEKLIIRGSGGISVRSALITFRQ